MKKAKSMRTEKETGPIREFASDIIISNYYIKIGLDRWQVRALTQLSKRWRCKKSPCAVMARFLISIALLDLDRTQERLKSVLHYMEAEGFHSLGSYCQRAMRANGVCGK